LGRFGGDKLQMVITLNWLQILEIFVVYSWIVYWFFMVSMEKNINAKKNH